MQLIDTIATIFLGFGVENEEYSKSICITHWDTNTPQGGAWRPGKITSPTDFMHMAVGSRMFLSQEHTRSES